MPVEDSPIYTISIDDSEERTEEYTLGDGTVILVGARQMVVAHSVVIRGLWNHHDELYSIQLDLQAETDALRILRQLKRIPQSVEIEQGTRITAHFELESSRVSPDILDVLADSRDMTEIVETEDDFPPVLNLMNYELKGLECVDPL